MHSVIDNIIIKSKRPKKSERIVLNPDYTMLLHPDVSDTMSKKICDAINNLYMSDLDFQKDHEEFKYGLIRRECKLIKAEDVYAKAKTYFHPDTPDKFMEALFSR